MFGDIERLSSFFNQLISDSNSVKKVNVFLYPQTFRSPKFNSFQVGAIITIIITKYVAFM